MIHQHLEVFAMETTEVQHKRLEVLAKPPRRQFSLGAAIFTSAKMKKRLVRVVGINLGILYQLKRFLFDRLLNLTYRT